MYIYETKIRVRYGETDQMGCVYHGNYAEFLEVARTEMIRELGLPYRSLEEGGVMMPVIEMGLKFHKPALYDDEIRIRVIVKKKPAVRMFFEYEIYNKAGDLLTSAHTTLAFIDKKTLKPSLPPAAFSDLVTPYFEVIV